MKKILTILIILILIILGVWLWGSPGQNGAGDGQTQVDQDKRGTVVLAVTDAAADMGAVSEINATIDSAELHSEAQGWVDVSTGEAQTYDLLALKNEGALALLSEADVAADSYNQLRLNVSSVNVVTTDGVEHDAKLPSGTLKMQGDVTVEESATSSATVDFLADRSLHQTGNGSYVFAPVVKLQTRTRAEVAVDANNRVQINGGDIRTEVTTGMNAQGAMKAGANIPADAPVEIGSDGTIRVEARGNSNAGGGGNAAGNAGGNSNAEGGANAAGTTGSGSNAGAGANAGANAESGNGGANANVEAGASGNIQY